MCVFLGPSSLTFICLPAAHMGEEEVDLRPPLASCAASAGFISLSFSVLVFQMRLVTFTMHQHTSQQAHESMCPSFSKPITSPSPTLATSCRWTAEGRPASSRPITQALTHIVYPLVLSESPPICHPQHKVTFRPPVQPGASSSGTCQFSGLLALRI